MRFHTPCSIAAVTPGPGRWRGHPEAPAVLWDVLPGRRGGSKQTVATAALPQEGFYGFSLQIGKEANF